MTRTALVLAAHGSRHEPSVNEAIVELAGQVRTRTAFHEVVCAFHQGSPLFSEVLDHLTAEEVTVVPVMTSAGWYSDTVLPRELANNLRFPLVSLRQTAPVGLHPRIADLIRDRAVTVLYDRSLKPTETTLAIVGHGTPRHSASRNSTLALVELLRSAGQFGEVIAAFLDDEPSVDLLPGLVSLPNVLAVPFLIAAGPHATRDLPRRIGLISDNSNALPLVGSVDGKTVAYDIPFGAYPEMAGLIADLALSRGFISDDLRQNLEQTVA